MAAEFVNRLDCIETHRQNREAMQDAMEQFSATLRSGLSEIRDELKELNSRTRKSESSIAVLQDRSDRVEHSVRVGSARWGSIGALVGGAIASLIGHFSGAAK